MWQVRSLWRSVFGAVPGPPDRPRGRFVKASGPREPPDPARDRPLRRDGLREIPVRDELLLYAPQREMAFSLNRSARSIWELCDGRHTPEEIGRELGERFGRREEELLPDVVLALAELRSFGVLREDSDGGPGSELSVR